MSVEELSIVVNSLPEINDFCGAEEDYDIGKGIFDSNSPKKADAYVDNLMEDSEPNSSSSNADGNVTSTLEVEKPLKNHYDKPKSRKYLNKAGVFISGIDPFSEETKAKAEERIRRFGQVVRPDDIVTKQVLEELYKSLSVQGSKEGMEEDYMRYQAIHLRGTDNLSTEDIFSYFQEFVPSAVEWINDRSCNVVWEEKWTAARAMLKLSHEIKSRSNDEEGDNGNDKMEVDGCDSGGETDGDVPNRGLKLTSDKTNKNKKDVKKLDLPPGRWRSGKAHPKSKESILMRFANKDDKKEVGANGKSKYYKTHGNPNYGGLKGLISKSCKQRFLQQHQQMKVTGLELESVEWKRKDVPKETNFDIRDGEVRRKISVTDRINKRKQDDRADDDCDDEGISRDFTEIPSNATRSKVPRMRMYADDEGWSTGPQRGGVWSRLGGLDYNGTTEDARKGNTGLRARLGNRKR